jgi:UDP-N-acetylmuramoyl-L-alanyl-D-glutamate--2,6-diaminopimelate ligase
MQELIYRLKRPYHFVKTGLLKGLPAQLKHGFPAKEIKIIALTGTDGKTTTSTLLYHILHQADKKAGLISTVAAFIGSEELDTGLHVTAPTPDKLQRFIKEMVKKNLKYLVLELTSHGAYQYRDWGIQPEIAGITNVSHEHLDYHLTYDNYLDAKALILKKAPTVFLNQDDRSFYELKDRLNAREQDINSYSAEKTMGSKIKTAINDKFPEKYNKMNARLAAAIALEIGLKPEEIAAGIKSFPGVPGRMESVKNNQELNIIIDFAHTPNGLLSALTALRKQVDEKNSGKLISVLGCAGLRDKGKRPKMGKISTDLSDLAVFTAEDPRTENIWSIIRQMKEQLKKNHDKVVSIADRGQAIEFALTELAQPGDTVAIFGKGPEKSMCIGKKEYPWSDKKAVKKVLKEMD